LTGYLLEGYKITTFYRVMLFFMQIIFNAIDGDGYAGDIALDQIMLFPGECGRFISFQYIDPAGYLLEGYKLTTFSRVFTGRT
jgi:hypothetical protein